MGLKEEIIGDKATIGDHPLVLLAKDIVSLWFWGAWGGVEGL